MSTTEATDPAPPGPRATGVEHRPPSPGFLPPGAVRPLALSAVLLGLAGCSTGTVQTPDPDGLDALPAGAYTLSLSHDGRVRMYRLHVPPGGSPGGPRPVLLAFHGGGGNAAQFENSSRLQELAREEGFLLVFPDGTGPGSLHTWNAGGCCGSAAGEGVDDVGFVDALLDHLALRVELDPARIYATGHSNGGMMSYRLAAELGDRVAAVAPVGGTMILDHFQPVRPVPILHIHSVDDPRALYEGGTGPAFPGTTVRVDHRPVQEALALWRAANGCPDTPSTVETRSGAPGTRSAGHTATLVRWSPCASGVPVEHWRLTGAGHPWPGAADGGFREAIVGPGTDVIHAPGAVWSFVSRFRHPAPRARAGR